MKQIILFLLFSTLSLTNITANEVKFFNPNYKQTRITKTIFPNLLQQSSKWYKKDSVNIILDFMDSDKIIVNENNTKTIYNVKSKKLVKYDVVDKYVIKVTDSKNIKHNIEVLYFKNNETLFTVVNDSSIERYILSKN